VQCEINSVYGSSPSHSRAQPLVQRYERRSADMLIFQSEKYYHLTIVGEGDQNTLRMALICPECAPDAYEIVDHHSLEVGPAWRSSSRDARILKTMRCLLNGCNSATTTPKVMKLKEVDLL